MRTLLKWTLFLPLYLLLWAIITLIVYQCNVIEWERRHAKD